MHRPMDTYDHIAIAEIIIYVPFLLTALLLTFRHGFGRSHGWYFLIILSLARIIGSCLRLATLSDALNVSLYAGWLTLNSLGVSPLMLMLLGLAGRVVAGISRGGPSIVPARYRRVIDIIILVSMVIGIVGGTNSTYTITPQGEQIHYSSLSRVSIGLMIAGFVLLVGEVLVIVSQHAAVESGERRLLLAVLVSLPFVLVRIVSAGLRVFGGQQPSVWRYLGMEVIMEMVVVVICLGVGLTLKIQPKIPEGSYEMGSQQEGGRGNYAWKSGVSVRA